MILKPWYNVVYPRDDLKSGRPLDAAEFAVHLDQVRERRGNEVYWQPAQFFGRTYLTRQLTDMAAEVVRRLSGLDTETSAVFNMSTQFGGGKTHTLTLLYHLAQHGPAAHNWIGVPQIVARAGVERIPQARTAIFVGQRFDPRGGDDGTPLRRTPWGEVAWQLAGAAGYALVARFDADGIAPGGDTLERLLSLVNQPVLILLDEVMNYVSRYRATGLGSQLYNFLQNLSEEARAHQRVVLAVSLPASELEMTEEDIKDYRRFSKMLDRVGKAVLISAESETAEIIRRRLFEWDDRALTSAGRVMLSQEAEETCRAYAEWVTANKHQLPAWFPVDNVDLALERFRATYPFHPTVLSVFERKWQTVDGFQKTRGVLRLLALWIAHAYSQGYAELKQYGDPLIGIGSAPLADPQFRTALFKQLGDADLEGAVTTDIAGHRDAHALRLDQRADSEAIRRARLHQQAATAIFFESNGGQGKDRQVATLPEIRLAVGRAGLDVGNVETVLEALAPPDGACYYLHVERNRYWYSTQPNLKSVHADREAGVTPDEVTGRVRGQIQREFGSQTGVTRIFFPTSSNDIPSQPALTVVVLSPEHGWQQKDATLATIDRWTAEKGQSARTYKSALIWMLAESDAPLREQARKLLAWESIQTDQAVLQLSASQREELEKSLRSAGERLREAVWQVYNKVVLLGKDNQLRPPLDLGRQNSSAAPNLTSLVVRELRRIDEIVDAPSPNYLVRNWPPAFEAWSTRGVRDAFFASPQFPRLLSAEAIKGTIARGVQNSVLAYVGKSADSSYQPFYFGAVISDSDVEIADDMYVITGEAAKRYLSPRTVATLRIEPAQAQLERGGQRQLTASGFNQADEPIAIDPPGWSATAGRMDASGLFTAPNQAGEVLITARSGQVTATARLTILAGPLPTPVSLTILPGSSSVGVGEQIRCQITAFDVTGQSIPVEGVTWSASVGSIDPTGLFTAGQAPGPAIIRAQVAGMQATASVQVKPGPVKARRLAWSGELPVQKWNNFYMKVLARFATQHDLKATLTIEISGREGVTPQKAEELRVALRELDLDDYVETS